MSRVRGTADGRLVSTRYTAKMRIASHWQPGGRIGRMEGQIGSSAVLTAWRAFGGWSEIFGSCGVFGGEYPRSRFRPAPGLLIRGESQ